MFLIQPPPHWGFSTPLHRCFLYNPPPHWGFRHPFIDVSYTSHPLTWGFRHPFIDVFIQPTPSLGVFDTPWFPKYPDLVLQDLQFPEIVKFDILDFYLFYFCFVNSSFIFYICHLQEIILFTHFFNDKLRYLHDLSFL